MSNRLKSIIAAATVLVLTLGLIIGGCASDESRQEGPALGRIISISSDSSQSPKAGKSAPDFDFQQPDGETTSLSDLQGKPVLLNFWASWCGPCVYEMPYLQEIYEKWRDQGLVILTINAGESSSTIKNFLQHYGFSLPVLLDTGRLVVEMYNIRGFPTTFLIDRDGIIQNIKIGAFLSKAEIEAGIRMVLP